MRWFQGSIAEAVAASKSQNAVFVVFVEGNDEASKATSASLDASDVASQLESADFVAIRLDSGSESYRQFAQIYQLVPVPSIFFIGGNGVPLEVVAGNTSAVDLLTRIQTVLEKKNSSAEAKATPSPSETTTAVSSSTSVGSSGAAAMSPSASSLSLSPADLTSESVSKEQKVEHAKQLLEQKRLQKKEQEEQDERNRELERRRMGQDVQRLRRWQQEQELKEMKEQRQKEKREEAAARERVLQQIAQDKAERAARLNQERTEEVQKPQQPAPVATQGSGSQTTRIQFRLPDGSTHTHQFNATVPLSEVRAYAANSLNLPYREFAMSTTFPRREFTISDCSRTVSELELVPTAVILILPAASSAVVSSPSAFMAATRLMWTLLAPLLSVWAYLRGLVFRGSGGPAPSPASQQPAPKSTGSTPAEEDSSNLSVRRRQLPNTSQVQRQGNVHRLMTRRDSSDDENNTWNGNSTQQM